MGASPHGRLTGAKATPVHHFRTKIEADVPLDDEARVEVPEIVADRDVTWHVLATVPRHEIRTMLALRKLGYQAYSPVETRWVPLNRFAPKLKRETQRAIFTRYVFVGIRAGQSWEPLREKDIWGRNKLGIIGVLSTNGRPSCVPVGPLAALAAEEREGWFDEKKRPELEKLRAGEAVVLPPVMAGEIVRIKSGPFASFQAVADADARQNGMLDLLISVFGRENHVLIPIEEVENLTRPAWQAASELRRA